MRTFLIFSLAIILNGCSLFTRPLDQPVIEAKLNPAFLSSGTVGTLSLTPERRVVLVNFKNNRFCAEAPTEVGIDVNQISKIVASAKKGSEFEAGLQAIEASANSNTILNRRTQGMQLYLASSYFICQMYMNTAITNRDAIELHLRTLNAVEPLIRAEIELLYIKGVDKIPEYKAKNLFNVPETINSLEFDENSKTKNSPEPE